MTPSVIVQVKSISARRSMVSVTNQGLELEGPWAKDINAYSLSRKRFQE